MSGPCKDCADRHTACWGTCEKYGDYKKELEALKRATQMDKLYVRRISRIYRERFEKRRWKNEK